MVASDAGEDWVASCGACGYAANLEKATSRLDAVSDAAGSSEPEEFATPGVRSIEDLANFAGGAIADRQIKTLVYVLDGVTTLALLRGDHALSEQKLADATGARESARSERRRDPGSARRFRGKPRRGRRQRAFASSPTRRCGTAAT